jgi:hypothetical protein
MKKLLFVCLLSTIGLFGCGKGGSGSTCTKAEECGSGICLVGTINCPGGTKTFGNICASKQCSSGGGGCDQGDLYFEDGGVCACFPSRYC